jgi:ABC-2 type transporter.
MVRYVRYKSLLFSSLLQPALWLAFFGIAMSSNFDRFTSGVPVPPGAFSIGYLTFMAAGMIAMTTLFTSLYGGIIFLFDKNWGLMREILASPLPRTHIIVGVGLSGMTKSFIQVVIITLFGLILGVRFFAGFSPLQILFAVVGMFAFVGVFSLGFLFLSSAIAVSMESPEGLQGVITLLTMPLFFVSNALYPIDSFPSLLQSFSAVNPLTHLISGIRYFSIGPDFYALGVHYSLGMMDVLYSFAGLLVFALVTFFLARWRFEQAIVT